MSDDCTTFSLSLSLFPPPPIISINRMHTQDERERECFIMNGQSRTLSSLRAFKREMRFPLHTDRCNFLPGRGAAENPSLRKFNRNIDQRAVTGSNSNRLIRVRKNQSNRSSCERVNSKLRTTHVFENNTSNALSAFSMTREREAWPA